MARRQVECVGLTTADLTYRVDRPLRPDVKTDASSSSLDTGGPAANAARTAALLGSRVVLHTLLGEGPLADFARIVLAGDGVQIRDHAPVGHPWQLPVSSAIVDGLGNRTVVSVNANGAPEASVVAAGLTDGGRTNPAEEGAVAAGAVVLVDGHHLDLALRVLSDCSASCVVVLDGGSWKPGLERLLPLVDVALLSGEFSAPPEFRDVEASIPFVAVSHGAEPIEVTDGSGRSARIPIERVEAVDTLGAGDVLHGALVHHLAGSLPGEQSPVSRPRLDFATVVSALEHAAQIATHSCRQHGVTTWAR